MQLLLVKPRFHFRCADCPAQAVLDLMNINQMFCLEGSIIDTEAVPDAQCRYFLGVNDYEDDPRLVSCGYPNESAVTMGECGG